MGRISRKQFVSDAAIVAASLLYPSARRRTNESLEELTNLPEHLYGLPDIVRQLMSRFRIPGLSLALVTDAPKIWAQGFGLKDSGANAPVNTATVFQSASLTKPVFAYAVLKLVDQKLLDLDQPLAPHLPAELLRKAPPLRSISARMLLSHTSGIAGTTSSPNLDFMPGERLAYAPLGFQLLQIAVERITSQSLADFMRVQVLEPFGMHDSSFQWNF